jgi:hypothetical protein
MNEFENCFEKIKNNIDELQRMYDNIMLKTKNNDPKYFGIPNINFSNTEYNDSREDEYSKQRIERGFDDSETWALDYTIARFILPRLKRFREIAYGIPPDETNDSWNKKLDKMIESFEIYTKNDGVIPCNERLFLDGFELFCKNFLGLWW